MTKVCGWVGRVVRLVIVVVVIRQLYGEGKGKLEVMEVRGSRMIRLSAFFGRTLGGCAICEAPDWLQRCFTVDTNIGNLE